MGNFVFNIAKGRVNEYFSRVKNNDPANSAIILVPLATTGTQATLVDDDTLSVVLTHGCTAAGASWGRKTLTDANLGTVAPTDASDYFAATLPAVTWTTPSVAQNTVALLVCYDSDTTTGTDANIVPLLHCDFVVTANGQDVTLNAGDCFRAS